MNPKIKALAKEAGFVFWKKESWGPGKGHIDWASNYDKELVKLVHLIVMECAEVADRAEPYKSNDLIKKHFGIEDAKKD